MANTISSRTPEGQPNHCPVCDSFVSIEPSLPPGDALCPNCGTLLWFLNAPEGARLHEAQVLARVLERLRTMLVARNLNVDVDKLNLETSFLHDLGADSLDTAELIMELESEFGVGLPEGEPGRLETIAELIDYLARKKFE
jgi:acyl carrier protein